MKKFGAAPQGIVSVDWSSLDVTPISANDLRSSAFPGCRYGCAAPPQVDAPGLSRTIADDALLTRVVAAWPQLPEHVRLAIGTLVRAAAPTLSNPEVDHDSETASDDELEGGHIVRRRLAA